MQIVIFIFIANDMYLLFACHKLEIRKGSMEGVYFICFIATNMALIKAQKNNMSCCLPPFVATVKADDDDDDAVAGDSDDKGLVVIVSGWLKTSCISVG